MPVTPDWVIGEASDQISAGQPVTALPRQNDTFQSQQAWIARMDEFDRQAKAARQAANQSARDAAMLDQMGRVAKSTKDIEVAMQSQDVMGFRNAVAGGAAPFMALQRFPRAASSPLVAAMKAAEAPFTPTEVTLPSGATGVRTGLHGEQFRYSPAPKDTQTIESRARVGTELTTPSGIHAVWVGPNQIRITEKGESKDLTPSQLLTYATQFQFSPNATNRATAVAIQQFLGEKAKQQMTPSTNNVVMPPGFGQPTNAQGSAQKGVTGRINPLPVNKSDLVADDLYDIKGGVWRWKGSKFEKVQ